MDLASHSPRATRPNTSCSYGGDASHSGYGPRESRVGLPLPEEAFDGTSLLEQEQGCFPVPPALERAATFPDGPGARDSLRFTPPVLRLMESEAGGGSLSQRKAIESKLSSAIRSASLPVSWHRPSINELQQLLMEAERAEARFELRQKAGQILQRALAHRDAKRAKQRAADALWLREADAADARERDLSSFVEEERARARGDAPEKDGIDEPLTMKPLDPIQSGSPHNSVMGCTEATKEYVKVSTSTERQQADVNGDTQHPTETTPRTDSQPTAEVSGRPSMASVGEEQPLENDAGYEDDVEVWAGNGQDGSSQPCAASACGWGPRISEVSITMPCAGQLPAFEHGLEYGF